MKTTARRSPVVPLSLAAALLTAFLVLFAPLPASAHDTLLASSPEADGTVETLPSELTLTFSNKLIDGDGATEIVVTDPSGTNVAVGAAVLNGAVVTQPLAAEAQAGAYHVVWKIVSSDGHPTSGEFSFTVSTATTPAPTQQATEGPTDEPNSTPEQAAPTEEPGGTASEGEAIGPWLLGIVGVLVAVGVVVAIMSRRGRGSAGDGEGPGTTSGDPSAR